MQQRLQQLRVRHSLALILIVQLAMFSAPQAQAFEARGHIAACELAWQLMAQETRSWIRETLADSPYHRFNAACPWPDKARDQREFKHTGPWHYINVPASAARVSLSDCPQKGCVLFAAATMKQRLLSQPHDWQALLFFSHFIADLHQPLHVSYADDRGGNRAKIRLHGKWTNLHRVWDGQLLGMYSISGLLDEWLQAPLPASRLRGSAADWATESLQLTRRIYQDYRQHKKVGEEYQQRFAPLLRQRLQLAGMRLAAELDAIAKQVTQQSAPD